MEPPASRCFTFDTTSAAWWGRGIDGLIGHVPSFLHDPNIENVYAASARIGSHHHAGRRRELCPLSRAEHLYESAYLGFDRRRGFVDELLASSGDGDEDTAAISRGGGAPDEPALLGPVDQPRHAGLVKLQKAR